jgi:uncharacterized protein (DUF1810 family)
LRHAVGLMLHHREKSALAILGSPDDRKFQSCLTLFLAAAQDQAERSLFSAALDQFYDGKADARSLELLDAH